MQCVARRTEPLSSVQRGRAGAEIRWARSTAAARESILRARSRARGPRRTAARRMADALRSRRAGGRGKITSANAPPARLVTTLIQWSSAWPANACAGAVDGLMSRGRVAARGGARGGGAVTYVGQDLGHAPGPAFAAGPPLHPEGAAGPVVARLVLVVVLVRRNGVCAALTSTTAAADRSALCDFFESQTATFGRFLPGRRGDGAGGPGRLGGAGSTKFLLARDACYPPPRGARTAAQRP